MSGRHKSRRFLLAVASLLALPASARADDTPPRLRIGSKRFTESLILGEIAAAVARAAGDAEVSHQEGLGGTAVVYRALEEGSIDAYPEYTGTIAEAILHDDGRPDLASIRRALLPKGILVGDPLGFDNTYALAVPSALARSRHLARISDLARAPDLRYGLSHEFLGRKDGWPGLSSSYGIAPANVQGLDHGLAYEAIRGGSIDVTDVYSTDAKIGRYGLTVLQDNKRFFPSYEAVFLYREDAAKRSPKAFAAVSALAGHFDAGAMIELNAKAEIDHLTFAGVAQEAMESRLGASAPGGPQKAGIRRGLLRGILSTVRAEGPRHLALTFGALVLSILVGLPSGIIASRGRFLGRSILGTAGVLQTIPSSRFSASSFPSSAPGRSPRCARSSSMACSRSRGAPRLESRPSLLSPRVGRGPGALAARHPAFHQDPARFARHPRRDQDLRGDQRGHGDAGGLHRRGRVRRAHSPWGSRSTTPI